MKIVIAFLLIASTVSACGWQDPMSGDQYNFNAIRRPDGWKVVDESTAQQGGLFQIDYLFNFCEPLRDAKCNNKENIAVMESLEVLGEKTQACEVTASAAKFEYQTTNYRGKSGVQITYLDGDLCTGSENPEQNAKPKQATFNVICGPQQANFKQLPVNSKTITKCTPQFVIESPAGCVGGVYSPSYSYFKIALCIFGIYLIAGTYLNIKNHGKSGFGAVPHFEKFQNLTEKLSGMSNVVGSKVNELRGQNKGPSGLTGSSTEGKNLKYQMI